MNKELTIYQQETNLPPLTSTISVLKSAQKSVMVLLPTVTVDVGGGFTLPEQSKEIILCLKHFAKNK